MRSIRVVEVSLALALAALPGPARAAMAVVHTVPVTRGPAAIVFDPVTSLAYVGSVTDDQVAVFSGIHMIGRIAQAGLNPAGLALDPAGRRLLVASFSADRVHVYDTLDRHRITSIEVADGPWGTAVDPASGRAFVAAFGAGALVTIERTNATQTIPLPGCTGPVGVAHNVAAARVLVTCIYSGNVIVLDAATLRVITTIEFGLGAYTWGIAAHPTNETVYVSNWGGGGQTAGTVAVLDAAAAAIRTVGYTGGGPAGLAVSPGGTPWVTLSAKHRVAVLDPSSATILDQVALPTDPSVPGQENNPQAVAVHPSGRLAIVGNFHAESVSFVTAAPYL